MNIICISSFYSFNAPVFLFHPDFHFLDLSLVILFIVYLKNQISEVVFNLFLNNFRRSKDLYFVVDLDYFYSFHFKILRASLRWLSKETFFTSGSQTRKSWWLRYPWSKWSCRSEHIDWKSMQGSSFFPFRFPWLLHGSLRKETKNSLGAWSSNNVFACFYFYKYKTREQHAVMPTSKTVRPWSARDRRLRF